MLFALGGIVAALNSDEDKPIKLVQLGIAAPAVISSYVNAGDPQIPSQEAIAPQIQIAPTADLSIGSIFSSSAQASDGDKKGASGEASFVVAGGLFDDILKSSTRNLGKAIRDAENQRAIDMAARKAAEEEKRKAAEEAKREAATDANEKLDAASESEKDSPNETAAESQEQPQQQPAQHTPQDYALATPPMHRMEGDVGSESILRAQQYLLALGYVVDVTGIQDDATSGAIRALKAKHGLEADVRIDRGVLVALKSALIDQPLPTN